MSIEADKATLRRAYKEMFNQGQLALADEVFAPDFLNHEAPSLSALYLSFSRQFGPPG
jgi:hypothetical protein